ncbi:MAG: LLM class F420-dependent oxidoreductase [Acidimicrobiia bacterium]
MQIGARVHASTGFRDFADRVGEMERAGLDVVWVAEAYGFDAATLMGYLAARTERVRIGSGILPVFSRPATLLAQTAAGLDHVSGGRAILGLGASNPQVVEGWFGVPFEAPVRRTREVVEVCRQVWRREVVRHEGLVRIPLPPGEGTGRGKALKVIPHPVRADIPIYLAALGPRNVALAAEVADGWMPLLFSAEHAEAAWGEALRRGLARRAPERGPLEVVAGGYLCIAEHPPAGVVAAARAQLALYLGGMGARDANYYADLARRYGYGPEVEVVQRLYASGRRDAAAAAVPDDLVAATNLIGPRGRVAEHVAALAAAGVTVLDVRIPDGCDGPAQVEALRALVG